MSVRDEIITKCLGAIEEKLQWGAAINWTHQDFLRLSEMILEETGQPLSYVTLKRVWGKVRYESKPTMNTLNVLARFLGHTNWRAYEQSVKRPVAEGKDDHTPQPINWPWWRRVSTLGGALLILLLLFPGLDEHAQFNPDDFHFSSATVRSSGIPNSVIFDINAEQSPFDSIEVQQSWDDRLRKRLPKQQTQHTSIYFYPGYFQAKLLIGGQVVKEHDVHIMSEGWYGAVVQSPVPVYYTTEEIIDAGKLRLTEAMLHEKGIAMQPELPLCRMGISQEFDQLKTDNFVWRFRLKHTYSLGSAACQSTVVYVLAEGAIMQIPLVAPGCVSAIDLRVLQYYLPGDQHDLSAFGVDFDQAVDVAIEAAKGIVSIYINDQLAYRSSGQVPGRFIRALDFRFRGAGEVEYSYLGRAEGDWVLAEDFANTQ